MTLSKIKNVSLAGRTWTNKNDGSTMHVHSYLMEDGVLFQANHKTEMPFKIGDEVDYTITKDDEQYGKSGTVKKPEANSQAYSKPQGNDDARQLMIVRQSSLNRAVEICIHNAAGNKIDAVVTPIDPLDIIELADRLTKWVMMPSNN